MLWNSQHIDGEADLQGERNGQNIKADSVRVVVGEAGRFRPTPGKYVGVFPCEQPVNPEYSDYYKRLQSFQAESWYRNSKNLKAEDLATAGLFYLGDNDRCKCFYCNGGLQHWEFGDIPIIEHAKYFPQCEFVLQHKGPDFIADLNSRFPNIKRPGLGNGESHPHQSAYHNQPPRNHDLSQVNQYQEQPIIGRRDEATNSHSITVDSTNQENQPLRNEDELIKGAEAFGFDKKLIQKVITDKRKTSNAPFSNLGDLVDAIIKSENNLRDHDEEMDTSDQDIRSYIKQTWRPQAEAEAARQPDLRRKLQSALDESICLTCRSRDRSCVFLSCGHVSCCYICGQNAKQCPLCKSNVFQTIRIYKT